MKTIAFVTVCSMAAGLSLVGCGDADEGVQVCVLEVEPEICTSTDAEGAFTLTVPTPRQAHPPTTPR